jgi:glycosyltransferase involved in cell wall biosynthesis
MSQVRGVAMFVYGDAVNDSRVIREADSLRASGRDVLVVAHPADGHPPVESERGWRLVRVGDPRSLRPGASVARRTLLDRARWLVAYGRGLDEWATAAAEAAVEWASGRAAVAWHGHDLTGLIAAARARGGRPGGRVVYDSHELFLEAGAVARLPGPARAMVARLERRHATAADAVITVNPGIAEELARRYAIPTPAVVMNCPVVDPVAPERDLSPLRVTFGLGDRPVLLHHGGLSGGRGIEETIDALDALPPEVALVILGNGELVPRIAQLAAERFPDRLYHHAAVPMEELPAWVAGADAGVIAFQPTEGNNLLATPNKLFECLAVGVPVVVSDFPEMRRIVDESGVGALCDPTSPESIAAAARTVLGADRDRWRVTCRAAATERYSWQRQSETLLGVYDRIGA